MNDQPHEQAPRQSKISRESAQAQIDNFLDYYLIDPDDLDDDDQKSAVQSTINKLRSGIMKGMVEIAVDGKPIVKHHTRYTENKNVLEYGVLSGQTKRKLDEIEGRYKRIHEVLGMLSKVGAAVIMDFEGADMSIAEALGTLFLLA